MSPVESAGHPSDAELARRLVSKAFDQVATWVEQLSPEELADVIEGRRKITLSPIHHGDVS